MGVPPSIENSTREERQTLLGGSRSSRFIGRTLRMLHGQNAEDAYAEYITGKRSYMDITLELRR